MIKKIIFILFFIIPIVYAGSYGEGNYGEETYVGVSTEDTTDDTTPSTSTTGTNSPRGGKRGEVTEVEWKCYNDEDCGENEYCFENKCYIAECSDDYGCNIEEGEKCWNYRCVKLFDAEIKDFESPVKLGEFFDFTYFIKGMANINDDVVVKFWIEKDNQIVTSGQDTIYLGSFEEKIKTTKLFLPKNVDSGTYTFRFEVTYGKYTAKSHRTIEIEVSEGKAEITLKPEIDFKIYLIGGLIGLFVLLLIYLKSKVKFVKRRRKKKKNYKSRIISNLNRIRKI